MSSETEFDQAYLDWTLRSVDAGAKIANFCDHREHIEHDDPDLVADSAVALQGIALEIAGHENVDLVELYANRLDTIEKRSPLWHPGALDGAGLAKGAESWRDLQTVQLKHNRYYHSDIVGLSRIDQLRHFSFHVSKLSGALAEQAQQSASREDFIERRLPDMLIFSILISTAVNQKLPESSIGSDSSNA